MNLAILECLEKIQVISPYSLPNTITISIRVYTQAKLELNHPVETKGLQWEIPKGDPIQFSFRDFITWNLELYWAYAGLHPQYLQNQQDTQKREKNNAVQLRVGSTPLLLLLGLQLIGLTFLKFGILSSVTLEIQVLLDLLPGLLRSLFWLVKIFLDMLAVDPQILSVFWTI